MMQSSRRGRSTVRLPAWLTNTPIAHRGLHGEAGPENSLPAFEAACQAGYPIELDVHVLPDREVIVFHDHDLLRAAGVARSLDEEDRHSIRKYRLFGSACEIPTLSQVLACVRGRVPLLIEIKTQRGRKARPLARKPDCAPIMQQLASYAGEFAVQSFNPDALAWFRRHAPQVLRGQLAGPLRDDGLHPFERFASQRLLSALISRPHFVNFDLHGLPDAWVNLACKIFDWPLLSWTVRTLEDQRKADALGVNYVFDHVRPRLP